MTEISTVQGFSVGRVLALAWASFRQNAALFVGLGAIGAALPNLLMGLVAGDDKVLVGVVGLVSTLTSTFMQASATFGAIRVLNGQSASLSDCLSTGGRTLLPILAISLLTGFGVLIGLVLLIVPGVILGLALAVSIPARLAEGPGVFGAMSRSRHLTKDHRLAILGLAVLVLVMAFIGGALFGGVVGLFLGLLGGKTPLIRAVVEPLTSAGGTLMFGIVSAATYVELRRVKEGSGQDGVAAVFD